jgi:hypothetical protein
MNARREGEMASIEVAWRSIEDLTRIRAGNPSLSKKNCDTLDQAVAFVMESLSEPEHATVTIRANNRLIELPEITELYAAMKERH